MRRAIRSRGVWRAILAVAVAMALPHETSAQEDLAGVERLVAEGRFGEGRDVLAAWLDEGWPGASRGEREQGIWLRAILTIDPSGAQLDYRRLVVEYPGGAYSDQALLRLAQGARAEGDPETAVRHLEALVRDYPHSPYRVEANSLLVTLAAEPSAVRAAARPSVAPPSVSGPPAAPTAARRPGGTTLPGSPDPSGAADVASADLSSSSGAARHDPSLPVTVQLGAFAAEAAARALASDPRLLGFEVRLVRVVGSPLHRVRIGTFGSEGEASDLLRDIRARGIPAIVSTDRHQEIPAP